MIIKSTLFPGFSENEVFTPIPDKFFQELLIIITDMNEMKIVLYTFWHIEHIDGPFRAMRETDFVTKELGLDKSEILSGIDQAIKHGVLIKSLHDAEVFYFLNSPRGRAAAEAFAKGDLHETDKVFSMPMERPNIFKLYEENIGPLTPMIADALKDAENTFSPEWITEALELAVKNNKRNWKYAEAILKRWKEEGRAEKQDRRDNKKSRQRDVEDKIKKFVGG